MYESAEHSIPDFIENPIHDYEITSWIRLDFTGDFQFSTSVYMLAILKRSPRQKSQLKIGCVSPCRDRRDFYY